MKQVEKKLEWFFVQENKIYGYNKTIHIGTQINCRTGGQTSLCCHLECITLEIEWYNMSYMIVTQIVPDRDRKAGLA